MNNFLVEVSEVEKFRVGSLNLLTNPLNIIERVERLAVEVERLGLDVLCMQEVISEHDVDVVNLLIERLGFGYVFSGEPLGKYYGAPYGNIILSKQKPVESFSFPLTPEGSDAVGIPAAVAKFVVNGREVFVFSVHLMWSGQNEGGRFGQAVMLTKLAESLHTKNNIIVLTGDFNARDQSSTINFLKGNITDRDGYSGLWVDAWEMFGTPENFVTSDPKTVWGGMTAKRNGTMFPEFIPMRRIDYVFVYEWAYGKHGSPLSFGRFADTLTGEHDEISDHFGIFSDIFVPILEK